MKKKLMALTLALALTASAITGVQAASDEAVAAANALNELGLFNGVGEDAEGRPIFELDRQPTRAEAVTMLVRLMGKEEEVTAKHWDTPFTDVDEWARPYVGYAYMNGLTKGTSQHTFGSNDIISASQYLAFVLRALGYDDTDFMWDQAWVLSDRLGITSGEYSAETEFTRGDVAIVSSNALQCSVKSSDKKLIDTLAVKNIPATVLTQLGECLKLGGESDKKGVAAAREALAYSLQNADANVIAACISTARSNFAEAEKAYSMASMLCSQYEELKTLGQMFTFLATIDNGNASDSGTSGLSYANMVVKSYDSLMDYYIRTANELAKIHKQ